MQHRPWRKTGFQATTLIAVALLLLILFTLTGYFFTLHSPGGNAAHAAELEAYERNFALWRSRRPAAFEYVVTRDCFCVAEYRQPYRVREDEAGRRASYASPLAPEARQYRGTPPEPIWLEDIFVLVRRAIDEADALSVSYDPGFGFPTSVTIDWSERAADEEQRLAVRDFRVIEYRQETP